MVILAVSNEHIEDLLLLLTPVSEALACASCGMLHPCFIYIFAYTKIRTVKTKSRGKKLEDMFPQIIKLSKCAADNFSVTHFMKHLI